MTSRRRRSSRSAREEAAPDIQGLRILLAEGNELNAEIAEMLLRDEGAEVLIAHDGRQALERFRDTAEGTFDAILMDVMMPVKDGLEATRANRALERADAGSISIIAMTANTFQEDAQECLKAGMNAHLSKPLDMDKLVRTLSALCRGGEEHCAKYAQNTQKIRACADLLLFPPGKSLDKGREGRYNMTKMIVSVKSSGVRAVAFSEEKIGSIRRDLLREGRKRAFTLGMRKTSVEELTDAVGIAKGSFYKFFPSKELLFFAVLEDIHTEIYAVAESALRESAALPPAERAAAAILAACRRLSETGAMAFVENDAEYLLRRLPAEVKAAHYHDDEVHIRALLEGSGLCPREGMALAAATVRGLILTVSHQGQIGPLYPRVLEMLVRGACRELFPAE